MSNGGSRRSNGGFLAPGVPPAVSNTVDVERVGSANEQEHDGDADPPSRRRRRPSTPEIGPWLPWAGCASHQPDNHSTAPTACTCAGRTRGGTAPRPPQSRDVQTKVEPS